MTRHAHETARVLFAPEAEADEEVRRLLAPAGFADWRAAHVTLRRMAHGPPERLALAGVLPHLVSALAKAAGPDGVLVALDRFLQSVPDRTTLLRHLREHPRAVQILVTLFAGSRFLSEILLRHPDSFARLVEPRRLAARKPAAQVAAEARRALPGRGSVEEDLDALRRYQRLELLRIGASDLLGLFDLETVTVELSSLADGLVQAALAVAERESGRNASGFGVVAMGKLGGRELNYSSDIDLLFLARADAPAYWKLGERLIEALGRPTAEGFLYRVDMRLRPWGDAGPLVSSVEAWQGYMARHARLWEKQALLKARPVAGDLGAASEGLEGVEPLLFTTSAETVRAEVRAMRQLTEREVRRKGLAASEVKLGEGSIRDVEFVAQFLQLAHGGARPEVRSGNTRLALARLKAAGVLPADDGRVLEEGYVFLRTVEHHLQVMHYRQTHTLPDDEAALDALARRLGFEGEGAGARFLARYREHTAAVRAVYLRHLGGGAGTAAAERPEAPSAERPRAEEHAARMDPSYAETFGDEDIRRHAQLADRLDESRLVAVDATPEPPGLWRVTIVGWDFPGELSLICGLLYANGFSILHGEAFTYEPVAAPEEPPPRRAERGRAVDPFTGRPRPAVPAPAAGRPDPRRKLVDVFTVRPLRGEALSDPWKRFEEDLEVLFRLVRQGRHREARGEIARRAALTQQALAVAATPLYPVDIEIDNEGSGGYTVLRIDAPDTTGFLYELTNALALGKVSIWRLTAASAGMRVRDTLWVTDASGAKITSPARLRELRAATVLIKHFTHILPRSPNPESALLHFGDFLGQLFARPDWPDELASLESPKVLEALARLLGVSDFLWLDFLRMQHANLFPIVKDVDVLAAPRPAAELERDLASAIRSAREAGGDSGDGRTAEPEAAGAASWRDALNAFKDRELFRIDMRHILGRTADIAQFGEELSDLAQIVVKAAFEECERELVAAHGRPRLVDGSPCPMAVSALGKAGGREMGFASDIELLFVYEGEGETDGPQRLTNAEHFERLVRSFVAAIRSRREGVFEIDLRLRPYGGAGSMAVSLDAFRRYYARGGPAWDYERQALIRLRPLAGDAELGRRLVSLRDALVYEGEPPDVASIRAMREKQVRQLVAGGTFNPKFSPGGLVDVEYLVQLLQLRHGRDDPGVRRANTREAMAGLAAAGRLGTEDHERLVAAQSFLRSLVEALRVVRGNARDVTIPPYGSEEFSYLARRLTYGSDVARLKEEMTNAAAAVQELSARLLA